MHALHWEYVWLGIMCRFEGISRQPRFVLKVCGDVLGQLFDQPTVKYSDVAKVFVLQPFINGRTGKPRLVRHYPIYMCIKVEIDMSI